ncbi:hypothetical protein ELE36_02510 [Pseudolysobacter antarcticus]|uniref:Apea-like HEPN domain-containing protein n=1 Tax=Pseudolysobacter antarcticus TaxID=2511995 RepID=A0A411HFS0_9GAMM|nr:hypothetical protein [Pseudolysobacter antarcticus]QBB69335.1 hypothetical protein ELE36_02510 [Pseudolysobacter antarcticus]
MPISDRFGFLKAPITIRFNNGWIKPCPDHASVLASIEEREHRDGYLYPPCISSWSQCLGSADDPVPIPNTTRPAAVFGLMPSHDIHVADFEEGGDFRHEDGALLVHLIAFLYETRLQFDGWKFDGRIRTRVGSFLFREDVAEHFIASVYDRWKTWTPELRRRFITILYMFGRAQSCLWEWERFSQHYMVFDALYAFQLKNGGQKIGGHGKRLIHMCNLFGVAADETMFENFIKLRNALLHEALWDNSTPGEAMGKDPNVDKWLKNFNARLIVAVAGYQNSFSRSKWTHMGWQPFDKRP